MTVSNSFDFQMTAQEVIQDAYALLGGFGEGYTISSYNYNLAQRQLNRWLKTIQRDGDYIFNQYEGILFLQQGVESYSISSTGDHSADMSTVVRTTLGTAESSGDTVLTLATTTGMTAADNIGIELTDGTRQWTTIASVDSSTQVTIDTALTGAAASGNTVYSYTTKLNRPLKLSSVRLEDENNVERELRVLSREEYMFQVDKDIQSSPISYFYDETIGTEGKLYLWPTSENVKNKLRFTYHKAFDDVDSVTDTLPLPDEWYDAVVYNLANRLAPLMSVDYEKINFLNQKSFELLKNAQHQTREREDVVFIADNR